MPEEQIIEIFKTKAVANFDAYRIRETKPCYIAKKLTEEFNRHASNEITSLPRGILSFYESGDELIVLEKERRKTLQPHLSPRSFSGLQIVHEPLTYDEISQLATAFVQEAFIQEASTIAAEENEGNCTEHEEKVDWLHIYKATLEYFIEPNIKPNIRNGLIIHKKTGPCFIAEDHSNPYRFPYDLVGNIPVTIGSHCKSGTEIRIPQYCCNDNYFHDHFDRISIRHQPLTYNEISELLTGFAKLLHDKQQGNKK